jgi:hypothetical protein
MRPVFIIVVAFAAILCIQKPAQANWCAYYNMGPMGGRNCGFKTFEQCLANVRGIGGNCSPSPYSSSPRRHQSTRHRPSYSY